MFSILYENEEQENSPRITRQPEYFKDLNLDQIVMHLIKGTEAIDLGPLYYTPLQNASCIRYRQEVMRDFEYADTYDAVWRFSKLLFDLEQYMDTVQSQLTDAKAFDNDYLTRSYCLDYAERYCTAIKELAKGLERKHIHSKGLLDFLTYLDSYCETEDYKKLVSDIGTLRTAFQKVHYCLQIKNGTLRVRPYEGQASFDPEITSLFSRFQEGETKKHRQKLTGRTAHHIEAAILSMLSRWYKDEFTELNSFCRDYLYFINKTIARFGKEVQFYLRWREYVAPLRARGLPFCYPTIGGSHEHLHCLDGFDLALAQILNRAGEVPVTNDFTLNAPEQILVITGPNQGGKTTFSRAFGQMFHLACIGCCVPGSSAGVFPFDHIFTHFSREEDLSSQNGKLQDDLVRLHGLLSEATGSSIIIVNEIFSSTTLQDALFLGGKMMERIVMLGAPGVCVTFLDELALFGPQTVSMMSTVDPEVPSKRTYKVMRKSADGLAFAIHIAQKYGLTYEALSGRLEG